MFPPVRSLRNIYTYWLKLTITPQVPGTPKVAAEDTTIVAGNIRGEKKVIPILKGTNIFIDPLGTHYNRKYLVFSWCLVHILMMKCSSLQNTFSARYWNDPHTFNPSRFLKDWPRDAFLPFSAGKKWVSLFKILLFFIVKNMQEPVRVLDESMWILSSSNQKPFLLFFFSPIGSPKLKAQQY